METKDFYAGHVVPVANEVAETIQTRTPDLWTVWKNRETGQKRVVRGPIFAKEVSDNMDKFEFVATEPHGDGDFSYLCGSDYCRCIS